MEWPETGAISSPHVLGIEYDIEEFSEGCYVQKTVITEINDENTQSELDDHEVNEN